MYSAVVLGRAYGTWLEKAQADRRTRRGAELASTTFPTNIRLPHTNSDKMRNLQPYVLRQMWNTLPWGEPGFEPSSVLNSLSRFMNKVLPLLRRPADQAPESQLQ